LKWDEINDEVDVAYTTRSYARSQFEPALNSGLFEDYMEQGAAKWTNVQNPWSIVDIGTYFSQSHSWRAANANASLETVVDLAYIINPVLKFRTYHRLNSNEVAYIKVSTDGNSWQTIATFSDALASWKTKVLDLSLFADQVTVHLRFELASAGGISDDFWHIEDVQVAGEIFDNDRDGLSNDQEGQLGTNPDDPDTDDDGLPDGWEVDHGFDPTPGHNDAAGDADGDGLTNFEEYQHATDPRNPDSDGDGLTDEWEVTFGFDPLDSTGNNGASGDPDGDGLNNGQEQQIGSDPNNPDTDGDTIPDGQDPTPGKATIEVFLPIVLK
jgi:hypothetical protein